MKVKKREDGITRLNLSEHAKRDWISLSPDKLYEVCFVLYKDSNVEVVINTDHQPRKYRDFFSYLDLRLFEIVDPRIPDGWRMVRYNDINLVVLGPECVTASPEQYDGVVSYDEPIDEFWKYYESRHWMEDEVGCALADRRLSMILISDGLIELDSHLVMTKVIQNGTELFMEFEENISLKFFGLGHITTAGTELHFKDFESCQLEYRDPQTGLVTHQEHQRGDVILFLIESL